MKMKTMRSDQRSPRVSVRLLSVAPALAQQPRNKPSASGVLTRQHHTFVPMHGWSEKLEQRKPTPVRKKRSNTRKEVELTSIVSTNLSVSSMIGFDFGRRTAISFRTSSRDDDNTLTAVETVCIDTLKGFSELVKVFISQPAHLELQPRHEEDRPRN